MKIHVENGQPVEYGEPLFTHPARLSGATGGAGPADDVQEDPDRQPRRDRPADHLGLPGARHQDGRRLLRGGRQRASTSASPTRPSASARRRRIESLPQHPAPSSARPRSPTPTPSTRATASWPRVAHFAEICEACNITFIGPGAGGHPPDGRQGRGQEGDEEGRRADRARAREGIARGTRSRRSRVAKRDRLPGDHQGRRPAAAGGACGSRATPRSLAQAFRAAQRRGRRPPSAAPDVYLEKYVAGPRHIEVQVLADTNGNVVHLGERECSIQRRHQKLIEESPSPAVDRQAARRDGRDRGRGGGGGALRRAPAPSSSCSTSDGNFYFMEMNTRIQVEHPVTEMVTGRRPRQGADPRRRRRAALASPEGRSRRGAHAIECRINAEDPVTFTPSPGHDPRTSTCPAAPASGWTPSPTPGATISPYYDSMIAKLIAHGRDRAEAIARMRRGLE